MLKNIFRRFKWRECLAVVLLSLPAAAHNGPPFPIIENKEMAGCKIALWTHPDVGTGTFFVLVDPLPGGKVPDDLQIKIGVQPVTNRLLEVVYHAKREVLHGQVQYNVSAQFDRQELWRVHLIVEGAQGTEEAVIQVEVTPPGYGRWDLLLYSLPFLAVALLWFRGITRSRRRRQMAQHSARS